MSTTGAPMMRSSATTGRGGGLASGAGVGAGRGGAALGTVPLVEELGTGLGAGRRGRRSRRGGRRANGGAVLGGALERRAAHDAEAVLGRVLRPALRADDRRRLARPAQREARAASCASIAAAGAENESAGAAGLARLPAEGGPDGELPRADSGAGSAGAPGLGGRPGRGGGAAPCRWAGEIDLRHAVRRRRRDDALLLQTAAAVLTKGQVRGVVASTDVAEHDARGPRSGCRVKWPVGLGGNSSPDPGGRAPSRPGCGGPEAVRVSGSAPAELAAHLELDLEAEELGEARSGGRCRPCRSSRRSPWACRRSRAPPRRAGSPRTPSPPPRKSSAPPVSTPHSLP